MKIAGRNITGFRKAISTAVHAECDNIEIRIDLDKDKVWCDELSCGEYIIFGHSAYLLYEHRILAGRPYGITDYIKGKIETIYTAIDRAEKEYAAGKRSTRREPWETEPETCDEYVANEIDNAVYEYECECGAEEAARI